MKLNFQVVLYEGTNIVEFRFGPILAGTFSGGASGASCGFKDDIGGDYHFYDLARQTSGLAADLTQSLTPVDNWPGADSCYHIVTSGLTAADEPPEESLPVRFSLRQNYPNPFNPTTTIAYDLAERAFVTLRVYDILGREAALLVRGLESPGYHSAAFNASALPSGVYFYRLDAGAYSDTKKLLLLR